MDPHPDLAFNRRGQLAPAQARLVDSMGVGSMNAGAMLPFLALFPLGALFLASMVAAAVAAWLGAVVFLALIGPTGLAIKLLLQAAKKEQAAAPALPPGHVVRTTDGFVAWSAGTWRAFEATPGGPRAIGDLALPPGPFRFYVFNRIVVGAESPLGPGVYSAGDNTMTIGFSGGSGQTTTQPIPIGDRAAFAQGLAAGVGFTPRDLEANRRGARSPAQGPGRIDVVEGAVQLSWAMRSKFTVDKFVVVDRLRFAVGEAAFRVIAPGPRYRVYFDPDRMTLLSLEAT